MNNGSSTTAEQMAAFQKIWLDSITKMTQTLFTFGPESVPQDMARQLRGGLFQALSQSWDAFLRSPQFLEGTKQWMDNAVAFRKMGNDFLTNIRSEVQATSSDDIDSVMLTVRHMEQRILDRIDRLAKEVAEVKQRQGARAANSASSRSPASKQPQRRKPRKRKAAPAP